jgi:hypothetical protein
MKSTLDADVVTHPVCRQVSIAVKKIDVSERRVRGVAGIKRNIVDVAEENLACPGIDDVLRLVDFLRKGLDGEDLASAR